MGDRLIFQASSKYASWNVLVFYCPGYNDIPGSYRIETVVDHPSIQIDEASALSMALRQAVEVAKQAMEAEP